MCNRPVTTLMVLSFVGIIQGMDTEKPIAHPFFELPTELRSIVIQTALDEAQNVYGMYNTESNEQLYIPYTLRPINPVVVTNFGDPTPSSWQPKVGENIFLDHQLWFKSYSSRIRLCEDTTANDDCFNIEKSGGAGGFTIFDGINKKRSAIFVDSRSKMSKLFLFRQSAKQAGRVENKEKVSPFLTQGGQLFSVMLHPDDNRILYSMSYKDVVNDERVIAAVPHLYSLNIVDITDDNAVTQIATKLLDVLVYKTIYLGANKYVGFTTTGKLIRIWLDDANTIHSALQNIMRYDESAKSYVQSDSVIKDIAVDDTYRTADGVRTHLAYVTNKGEVFVIDLGSFVNSTPMLNTVLHNAGEIQRLFYDKGQLAVLYRDGRGKFGDFIVWPDNLGPLYLKTVLMQQARR